MSSFVSGGKTEKMHFDWIGPLGRFSHRVTMSARFGIGATIRIDQDIQCLRYAFKKKVSIS